MTRIDQWIAHARRRLLRRPATEEGEGVRVRLDELVALRHQALRYHLAPRRAAGSAMPGEYRSLFRGRGLDFEEFRVYQPGDDVRSIDWSVTARTGRVHTKVFREERERAVFIVVDYRPGMFFGTRHAFKSVTAARVAALLAWAACENGDRVGGLIVGADRLLEERPRRGRRGVLRLLRALVDGHVAGEAQDGASLALALARLRRVAHTGSLIFVLSDFADLDDDAMVQLAGLARQHDVLGAFVYDPLEAAPPPSGRYPVTDGARAGTWDVTEASARERHVDRFRTRGARVVEAFVRQRSHLLRLSTEHTLDESVRRLLDVRHRTRHAVRRRA